MPSVTRAALVKARERRVALDRDRQARDSRVEQAAARVFLGVEQRAAAERAVQDADVRIGTALRELLAERITVEDVAQLCDLDVADVRRLLRLPARAATAAAGPAQADGTASADASVPPLRRQAPDTATGMADVGLEGGPARLGGGRG